MAANLLQHAGHELELVVHEREAVDEVLFAGKALEIAARVLEREQVLQHHVFGGIFALQQSCGSLVLVEHALLDDLVHARRGKRQPGGEAALNLREVHGHDVHELVDCLLACYHHPNSAAAVVAELFHEGLEVEHAAGVAVEVLAHLVDHEQQTEALAALCLALLGVFVDVVDERSEIDERGIGAVGPVGHRLDGHSARPVGRLRDLLAEHVVTLAVVDPGGAGDVLVGRAELVRLASIVNELLEASELVVHAVEAEVLVEHACDRPEHRGLRGFALLVAAALVVDVEQDGLRTGVGGSHDARVGHGVVELAVEVLDGALALDLLVLEEVAEHLQEVRFAASEVALDPYTGVSLGAVEATLVGLEEVGEVTLQLARHDVFIELLLDGALLADADDAVDVSVDVSLEHLLNLHGLSPKSGRRPGSSFRL